jgi:hypothetical protein
LRYHTVELITDAAEETPTGGLKIPAHINRTGIQTYQTADGVSREYRSPDEVFSKEALDSFRGVPVTLDHPASGTVDTRSWRNVAVGHIGDDVRQDGDLTLATVYLEDQDAIDTVRGGTYREASAGYTTTVRAEAGESPEGERYDAQQTNIRGNHVAIVKRGRGGPRVRLHLDSEGNQILEASMSVTKEELRANLATLKADLVESAEKTAAKDRELETLRGKCDALKAENKSLQAKLDSATSDDVLVERVNGRLALVDQCRKIKADVRTDGSDREIIVDALGDRVTADATDDYLRGALAAHVGLVETKSKNDAVVNDIVNPSPAHPAQTMSSLHRPADWPRGSDRARRRP